MKLWLLRHAQPRVAEGVCYGATDVAANPQVTGQVAVALAQVVSPELPMATSPLRRCRQLADALQALRPDLSCRVDERLAEMDFGCWEGWRWSAIGPDEFDRWTADFCGYRFGGRESVGELMTRVAAALDEARQSRGDALWVTHAGVIRAVRLLAAGVGLPQSADQWPRETIDFGRWEAITL